jgi:hypothetical protein
LMLRTHHHGDSISTADLRRPAALASYVSFVIMFSTIDQNMRPAYLVNNSW